MNVINIFLFFAEYIPKMMRQDNKIIIIKQMKKFRSSKALKPLQPHIKQQYLLKQRIKQLQEQVSMLQKSNLNIFTPFMEQVQTEIPDYKSILNKMRAQIIALEQQNQGLKGEVKRVVREKVQMQRKMEKEIESLREDQERILRDNQQLKEELQEKCEEIEEKNRVCEELEKNVIQKNVELRFLKEDIKQQKSKRQNAQNSLKQLKWKISQVVFSSRIYKSNQVKCICIEKQQYDSLRDRISQLENQIKSMIQSSKRQKITLGYKKNDIGEEIVRLKKNIDLQLGIQGESKHSEQFLKIYKGTNELFSDLIKKCQA